MLGCALVIPKTDSMFLFKNKFLRTACFFHIGISSLKSKNFKNSW